MNKQAMLRIKRLQQEMIQTQKEIEGTEFSATSGPVTLVMLGKKEIKSVSIDKDFEFEDRDDIEMVEDAIVALSRQLTKEIEDYTEEKMSKYTSMFGGMGGLF
jgi:DNA-binding protein YbaB